MSRPLALAAALLLSSGVLVVPVQAQTTPAEGVRRQRLLPQLTPEQQQKLFPGRRELILQEQRERIALLQRGQLCVSRAGSSDALRACMLQERREQQELRSRFREQMRALFARNGIALPELDSMPMRRRQGGGPQGPEPL